MSADTQTPSERLEQTRAFVRERAYEGRDYYVAIRDDEKGGLKIGFGSMEFAARTGSLHYALYYEVWTPQGECTTVVVGNERRLRELGGFDLPLSYTPAPFSEGLKAFKPATSNPAPLWWEVERAEKARKLDELVAMRREVRAMLNYD